MAGSFPEGDFSLDESLSNASTVDYSTFTRHRGNRYPASRKSLQSQNQKAHGFSLPSAMPHGRESAFHYAPRPSGQDGSLSLQSGRDHFTFSYTSGKSDITDLSRDASELTEYSDTQIHGPRMMDQYVTSPRQGYDGAWSNDDYGVGLSSASNLQEEFSKTFVTERKNTTAPVVFESQQYLSCDTDNYTGALLPSSNAGFLNIYTRGDGQTTQPDMVRGVRMRSTALSGMPTALAMDSIESLDSFNIQATSTQELRPSRRSLMGNRRISMDPVSLEVPTPEFAGTNWGFPDLLNVGAEGFPPVTQSHPYTVGPSAALNVAASSIDQYDEVQYSSPGAVVVQPSSEEVETMRLARSDPLYQASPASDGYHCPFAAKEGCMHKPTKLKCNYDKYIDSHLRPFRCKTKDCAETQFSSTACLLRHEREAHGMHGHGARPHLCTFNDCDRAVPGNGFPRRYNLYDHMKRVHDYSGSMSPIGRSPPDAAASVPAKRQRPGRKRKVSVTAEGSTDKRPKSAADTHPASAVPAATIPPRNQHRQQKQYRELQWMNQRNKVQHRLQYLMDPQDILSHQRIGADFAILCKISEDLSSPG
ncbi:hypothetical protein LTR16_001344 [Cryomyces antarcticus]|uniref:C2H2-type domain-containing protein n=1 Tax=Cryomyces antarcticus TaxID=329879 RepID=A0ABR0MA84_9PEZI|nr:hypothetical protein LTR16_001344 [Cryomyces antarcticus]